VIVRSATEITLMTWSSSWVAMMDRPSGEKNASSGWANVWPRARSPGRGNSHLIRPCGSTISSRLLWWSAMSTSAGSTAGSEPGASRPGPAAGASQGAPAPFGISCPAGTSRNVVTVGTGRPPASPPIR
jgi:hypothetical protein